MSMAAGGSSSNITLKKIKYDVFINFRGEDTRSNFTSHLHSALSREKIKAFIDENDLKTGDEISPTLLKAIEDSKFCLIILSEDYASSRWCLEELAYILQCKKTNGQSEVLPVFYNVKPSDVRKQQGSYAVAFAKLEEHFEDEKLQAWRDALRKIADLSGWTSKSFRSEAKLVDTIVDVVIKKLRDISTPRDDLKGLVGVITRIEKIESLLHIGSLNVGPVGIWGIGGIGKTTLARAVFNRLSSQFEACSFLENVREQWKKHGPNHLKNKLFSELMEGESSLPFTKDRLRKKRVLVVFDDVDDAEQFEQLVGDWFGPESKILVTSRDQQVLRNIEVSRTYEVKGLKELEALKLFFLHAFKKKSPTEKERELSKRAVNYAGGVPLALIVFGRHVYSKSIKEWESTLDKLQKIPDKKIHNVLKISYDSLDDTEKDIFLDIACFYKGKSKDFVERILDGCGFFAVAGIKVLIDKALITIDMWNTLRMHDLLQMMAFEIVHAQSTDQEPRKGSRLWIADDIYHTFKYNRGIDTIEGISLDTSKLNEEISLTPETFSQMCKLRILMINGRKVSLPQGPLPFPNSLRYLKWDAYPLKSLSKDFTAKNLVELDMPRSKLKQLWNGVVNLVALDMRCSQLKQLWNGVLHLANLKRVTLTGSMLLTQLPDLSQASNLESIDLNFCENLLEIPSSFQNIKNLEKLELIGCSSLRKILALPKDLGMLRVFTPSFERQDSRLVDCQNCEGHESDSTCRSFQYRNFPCHIHNRKKPSFFISSNDICEISHFKICSKMESFPEILDPIESLKFLGLEFTPIKVLPQSIKNLINLRHLRLDFCLNLESLPNNIHHLSALRKFEIRHCPKLKSLPTLPLSVTLLDASYCMSLKKVSSSSTNLVTQNWDDLYMSDSCGELFEFYGCQMLNATARGLIMDEAHFRILRLAVFRKRHKVLDDQCRIRWPGSEIPRWFNHKSEGRSICINFPNQQYNSNYLGLAFSIFVYFDGFPDNPYGDRGWKICCDSVYTFPNGVSVPRTVYLECSPFFKYSASCFKGCCGQVDSSCEDGCIIDHVTTSDHVCVFFYGHLITNGSVESPTTASFTFSASKPHQAMKVKKCGVHLLHTEEAERFGFVVPHSRNWNSK